MATPVRVSTAQLLVPLLVSYIGSQIQVRKRNGSFEPADVNKIVRADDVLSLGVSGLSPTDVRDYLQYVADRRLEALSIAPVFHYKKPFGFMELQDVQELTNFFERGVSAYQVAVKGKVAFHEDF